MRMIYLVILIILPLSGRGYLTCKIACRNCKERHYAPELLNVYCEMCQECRLRTQGSVKNQLAKRISSKITNVDDKKRDTERNSDMNLLQNKGKILRQIETPVPKEYEQNYIYDADRKDDPESYTEQNIVFEDTQRPENIAQDHNGDNKSIYVEYSAECPTPASCSEEEEVNREKLKLNTAFTQPPLALPMCSLYPCVYPPPPAIETTTTSCTPPSTTTTMPPVHHLKVSHQPPPATVLLPAPPCFMPFALPCNPCPNSPPPYSPTSPRPMKVIETTIATTSKTTPDHFFVYVGVPNQMLQD